MKFIKYVVKVYLCSLGILALAFLLISPIIVVSKTGNPFWLIAEVITAPFIVAAILYWGERR